MLSRLLFGTDFRFWIWAFCPLDGDRLRIALGYAPLWFAAFVPASGSIAMLTRGSDRATSAAFTGAVAMAGDMVALVAVEYGAMVAFHRPATPGAPLVSILAIQLVPVLAVVGAALAARRTGSIVPGAAICALLVAWHITAGTTTHWTPDFPRPVLPFAAAR